MEAGGGRREAGGGWRVEGAGGEARGHLVAGLDVALARTHDHGEGGEHASQGVLKLLALHLAKLGVGVAEVEDDARTLCLHVSAVRPVAIDIHDLARHLDRVRVELVFVVVGARAWCSGSGLVLGLGLGSEFGLGFRLGSQVWG